MKSTSSVPKILARVTTLILFSSLSIAQAFTPLPVKLTPDVIEAGKTWHVQALKDKSDNVHFLIIMFLKPKEPAPTAARGDLNIKRGEDDVCSCTVAGSVSGPGIDGRQARSLRYRFTVHRDYLAESSLSITPSRKRGAQSFILVLGDFEDREQTGASSKRFDGEPPYITPRRRAEQDERPNDK